MTASVAAREEAADVEGVFRQAYGQAVATLVRVFGDIDFAEDAVQDAFVIATSRWREDGIPTNPAGWIVTTARNRAIDVLRRSTRGHQLQQEAVVVTDPPDQMIGAIGDDVVRDDRLRLIFTCCHPSLRMEHQVALTLRLLGGLSVDEIARSFLVTEPAMAKRLVRAKYKIKAANIPYRVPAEVDLPERLRPVLSVIYLVYNTGVDQPERGSLRQEAMCLGRALSELLPDEPEVAGLLALMLLNESRMPARMVGGEWVVLRDQDRTRWDRTLIEEGQAIVRACIRRDRPGPHQLQAAIQAVHCSAGSFENTDWQQIVTLYDHLYLLMPNPVVALNRAIALGETEGPESELVALNGIASDLEGYHLYHSARGATLRRLGRGYEAKRSFERALGLATSEPDLLFLASQIEELSHQSQ